MTLPPSRWVLLRGLGREARHWHRFPELFSEALGGVEIVCLDLPGAGTERERSSPASIRKIALDVLERWPLAEESSGIIGISLGGMVALELNELAGESLGPTIVINASSGLNRSGQRLKWKAARSLFKVVLTRDPLARELAIGALTSGKPLQGDPIYRERAAIAQSAPFMLSAFLQQLIAGSRFTPPLLDAAPLLFLCSAKDEMVDPECSEALASYYGAPLYVHPWAGHDLPIDDPEWVCERARAWVQGLVTGDETNSGD